MSTSILVTVSRSYRDWATMRAALADALAAHPGATLVHGDARRGDRDAERIWRELGGGEALRWPADWAVCAPSCDPAHRRGSDRGEWCPTAGHRRNRAMVDSGPVLCLAFIDPASKTKGASSTADLAESAGFPVVRYLQEATS